MTGSTGWQVRAGRADDAQACEDIIAGLPDFFTSEVCDKIRHDLVIHDSWVITEGSSVCGFAIVARRTPAAAEILWAAIAPNRRNQGIGTTLIAHILDKLRDSGTTVVEVKTLDPSAGYPPYAATYRFWTTRGFIHIDTIEPLPGWEPGNPCAILIAALASSR
ncbi:GNAT family N-acetyltransferase [Rhizomonospora bruguierae]|uniref:GNAT family N-acetyltransferase n=1 Tax=Rhizomonospora bruguierae TaxID=1581705 RepID=UPI001BCBE0D0|nr:GNAT family N-acetyltransferase [Micromonospora sp. NBRC 107566]